MIAMGMVEMAIDEVVDMITMGDCRVTTIRAVNMVRVVSRAVVLVTAAGVGIGDLDGVFVVMALVRAMQMAIVKVADMITVLHGDMSAVRAVFVIVVFVDLVGHGSALLCELL